MSPALRDMDTIARMQRALMSVRDLDDDTQRATAYIRADISDVGQALFDGEAARTERLRRECMDAPLVAMRNLALDASDPRS